MAPALFFRPNAEQTPFLIYPGESIHIKSAGNDLIEMYIDGNQQRTNELNFFAKLVKQTGNIFYAFTSMSYHRKVGTLNEMKGLEDNINQVKNTRLEFLANYIKTASVSDTFKKIATSTIRSTAVTDSLFLYFNNRELLKKQNLYQTLIVDKIGAIEAITPGTFSDELCNIYDAGISHVGKATFVFGTE